MGRGVVSEAGGTPRRRQYEASDHLYAIYYRLRRSRGADESVRALVAFMDAYYSKPGSKEGGRRTLEDHPSTVGEIQATLETLPEPDGLPPELIETLVSASRDIGFEKMATLIRESPSAARLLPLTTALELEMGLEPRVAVEVREVAEDIRKDLAQARR